MDATLVEAYAAVFEARSRLLPADGRRARMLVTDDRALDQLRALLAEAEAGLIAVFETAPQSLALVAGHAGWKGQTSTAMACRDLAAVPELPLPGGLTLRPVRRVPEDPPGGVPLADAVALVLRADPDHDQSPEDFADFLRGLPPSVHLLCAVDEEGTVRATSGVDVFGREAHVFFVNTDPDWRRRGIGQAMTAAAVRLARDAGALQASLDASDAGYSVYRRVGFEVVGPMARFFR